MLLQPIASSVYHLLAQIVGSIYFVWQTQAPNIRLHITCMIMKPVGYRLQHIDLCKIYACDVDCDTLPAVLPQ